MKDASGMEQQNMNDIVDIKAAQVANIDPMMSIIERAALSPDLPLERMNALMDMRERQMRKEAEQAFNQAFALAMSEIGNVPRTGHNKHLGNRYSTLDDLIKTARPALARHGLSLNWQTKIDDSAVHVCATVRHALGHSISTDLSGPKDNGKQMNALQGAGSTETYLKRYTAFSLLGLASGDEVDDDGRAANTPTITADQARIVGDMIKQAGLSEDVVCKAEGLSSIETMPAQLLQKVKDNLRKNIERKEAQQ